MGAVKNSVHCNAVRGKAVVAVVAPLLNHAGKAR